MKPELVTRRERIWLLVILAAALALRLWVWPDRWINPDEGAHLMDGRLALHGLVPLVDFSSRQVVYTYLLAGLIGIVGPNFALVRLGVVLVSTLSVWLVYLLARRLFGGRTGLAAAGIYALLPLAVIWAPIVHIEPFSIAISCIALLAVVRHLERGGWRPLAAAGLLLGIAFYVRETSLAAMLAALVALAAASLAGRGAVGQSFVRRAGTLVAGFIVPVAVIGALYSSHMTPKVWWHSALNPLALVLKHTGKISRALGAASPVNAAETIRRGEQPWEKTLSYIHEVTLLNAALFVGILVSLALLARAVRRGSGELERVRLPFALLYAWIGGLGLIYGYWSVYRGFFPQYAEEFLPGLSILLGFVLVEIAAGWPSIGQRFGRALIALAVFAAVVFVAERTVPSFDIPNWAYFVGAAVVLAWWYLPASRRTAGLLGAAAVALASTIMIAAPEAPHAAVALGKALAIPAVLAAIWLAAGPRHAMVRSNFGAFAGAVLVVGSVGLMYATAGRELRADYETVWSPKSVREIAGYLERNAAPGDEVLSGAVMWELEADRPPFDRISHPLAFMFGLRPDSAAALAQRLEARPPAFVVLDGYTEQTFGAVLPGFQQVLNQRYALVDSASGSNFPVRLYELRERMASE